MSVPTIFTTCKPRDDVRKGTTRDEQFAADLAQVVSGNAPPIYREASLFFQHTFPTRGLRALFTAVCRRLSGRGGEVSAVLRLDTQYGGGKTHALIGLTHVVRGMKDVPNIDEFVDPALLPHSLVRVAALDGENADPADGVTLEPGLRAYTLWGELAYRLAGRAGYERLQEADRRHIAPGAATIQELFGGELVLIMIDEVSVYLRKAEQAHPGASGQFTAFLQGLIKAVESSPHAMLVFTLAVGKDNTAKDAYRDENERALRALEEAQAVAARKATTLNPTEEDEVANVLRRRLFEYVDQAAMESAIEAYSKVWQSNRDTLPPYALRPEVKDAFRRSYPLHPELLQTLTEKTSSLATFHRTRGMLRLLARAVHRMWETKPADAYAIHLHHVDLGFNLIRDEVTTRWGQASYTPALKADVAGVPGGEPALAQELDTDHFAGGTPVASYVARVIFLHTMAYGDAIQGVKKEHLRFSVCSPGLEPAFADRAASIFIQDSLFLDDRPGAPLRFRVEPNLTQMIRRQMVDLDMLSVRSELKRFIGDLFTGRGGDFEAVLFPGGPYEVPDEVGNGRPHLVIMNHEALALSTEPTTVPPEIADIFRYNSSSGEFRKLRNNLVFLIADERRRDNMRDRVARRMALGELRKPERMKELPQHQQQKIEELYKTSELEIAEAVLHCYRHLFYPWHVPLGTVDVPLTHTAMEVHKVSDSPGGQGLIHLRRALKDAKKLQSAEDDPEAPSYVRDQTPLKVKGELSTQELRLEFRRAPKLAILLDDTPLIKCIRRGIEEGTFVYRKGDLLAGPGDPFPNVSIGEDAFVHTMQDAVAKKLWPRRAQPEPTPPPDPPGLPPVGPGPMPPPEVEKEVAVGKEPPSPIRWSAEGPLASALNDLWDKARRDKQSALKQVILKFFEGPAAFRVHGALPTLRDVEVGCSFEGEIVTAKGGHLRASFRGNLADANAVKQFLEAQTRTATDSTLEFTYTLTFPDGLALTGEAPDNLRAHLTKFGAGEAYVEAHATLDKEAVA